MASPSNKPRDIKNLKARLGRTITPGQAGVPTAPTGGGSVPPAHAGGAYPPRPSAPPAAPPGTAPRPANPGAPFPRPGQAMGQPMPQGAHPQAGRHAQAGGQGNPGPSPSPNQGGFGSPAPPPPDLFGHGAGGAPQRRSSAPPLPNSPRPSMAPQAPMSAGGYRDPAANAKRADPFAAAAAPAPDANKKVTLVIDDSAVKSSELGRGNALRSIIVLVLGLAVGAAVGWGIGGTSQEREQYNLAIRDGKEIYQKVQETAGAIDAAATELTKAVTASAGGEGGTPQVDYGAISSLVAMQKPFSADAFHRRRYRAFPPDVVDNLFDYYNNINLVWSKISLLGARTSGPERRAALDASAKAAGDLINHQYGVVLAKSGDAVAAGLVYVDPIAEEQRGQGQAPKLSVSSSIGGRSVERTAFLGQRDLGANYQDYVILLDKLRSKDILGQGVSAFAEYRSQVLELDGLMKQVKQSEARLLSELEKISKLQEQGVF